MKTEVVKISKTIKDNTSAVRAHLSVVERAREIYLGQIKRAETEYFHRIESAAAILHGDKEIVSETTPTETTPTETTEAATLA